MVNPKHSSVRIVLFLLIVFFGIWAVIVAGFFAIPVILIAALAKGIHWYANRSPTTDQLHSQAQEQRTAANFPDADKFVLDHILRLLDAIGDNRPAYSIYRAMFGISDELYRTEGLNNRLPPLAAANGIEEGRYRDELVAYQRKTRDPARTLELFSNTLGALYLHFIKGLPPVAKTTREEFQKCGEDEPFATIPLIDMMPNPREAVFDLMSSFYAEDIEEVGLFGSLRKQLNYNVREASGHPASSDKLIMPDKHRGTPEEVVTSYLHDTPLPALFYAPVGFTISDQQRYEHMHVVGGSGHGKTQLLQRLILTDLQRERSPALVIVDSQGEMLRKIEKLDLFAPGKPLADRIVIIDPEDVEHPPALNMFDTNPARLGGYSQTIKEQIEASTIETFNYIFGALAAELTSRQNTTFAFVTRLLLSIPGATIHTLRQLFEDGATSIDTSPFVGYIRKLDLTSQAYFQNQFFTKTYSQTKQQIARRLYSVLQVPAFDRMFASQVNRVDVFEALQRRFGHSHQYQQGTSQDRRIGSIWPIYDCTGNRGCLRADCSCPRQSERPPS